MDLFANTTVPVLEQVIQFAQARHAVLAGNVANLDTPGYRVRDLSPETFQARLKEAIEARDRGQTSLSTSNMTPTDKSDPMYKVKESMKSVLYHDNSDVAIEQQVAQITKNQFNHNMAITLLTSQMRMLQTAVSERV